MKTRALLTLAGCLLALTIRADDWPQFRGPNRDGISKEKGLKWPAAGPNLVWTYKDAGAGYSSPAIVGDTLYLTGERGGDEYLFALDLTKLDPVKKQPTEKWGKKIGPKFMWKNGWITGPSSSPTVADGLVYALGTNGDLVCFDLNGVGKWSTNLPKNLSGEINPIGGGYGSKEGELKLGWGYAASPLVDGNKLICVPGGNKGLLAALDAKTGNVIWQSGGLKEQATYSSPVLATIEGAKQYIIMTQDGVAGVDPSGVLLWRYKRAEPYEDIVAATPLVKDNFVFISAAGGTGGCDLIEIKKAAAGFTAEKVYSKKDLANFHGGMVLVDDHVYGSSGDFGRTKWVCVDFKTGDVAWAIENRKLGKGSVMAADGNLYCLGEKGAGDATSLVVRTPASPKEKLSSKESFSLPESSPIRPKQGGAWTHPVIANGKLYLRDQELVFCYELK
jgi:outer membrane protein assembly factor BamB